VARKQGQVVGYCVLRRGDFDGVKDLALVCDWLVPPVETKAAAALRAALVAEARQLGAERIALILPDTCADWLAFQLAGFRAAPTRYFVICRNYVKRYDPRWLYRHWYYTLGDTDLC
jgi:hypothetical protein